MCVSVLGMNSYEIWITHVPPLICVSVSSSLEQNYERFLILQMWLRRAVHCWCVLPPRNLLPLNISNKFLRVLFIISKRFFNPARRKRENRSCISFIWIYDRPLKYITKLLASETFRRWLPGDEYSSSPEVSQQTERNFEISTKKALRRIIMKRHFQIEWRSLVEAPVGERAERETQIICWFIIKWLDSLFQRVN